MHFCIKMDGSCTVEFPKKLLTNFKRQVYKNVELKGPSGITWHVKMMKSNGYCEAPVDYDCAPQQWRAMSAEQKARANRLALQVQMGNPSFVYVLKRSCRTTKSFIVVPKHFSAKHLLEENQTLVLHRPGREDTWSVRYYFRKYHQSIEGSSWVKFVQENNLREGDILMFEVVDSAREVTFTVHVSQTA